MEKQKKIDFENEDIEYTNSNKMEELQLTDLGSEWVPHPKVGEEIELDIAKVFRDKNIDAQTKEGKKFKTNLSGVDFKYTIETTDGKRYSPGAWEVWGKMREIMKKKGTTKVKVRVKHLRDGMANKDGKDNYEVTEF